MDESRAKHRPVQVTAGGWGTVVAAVLLVASAYDALAGLHSIATREAIAKALGSSSVPGMHVSVAEMTSLLHVLLLVAGAGAAVVGVLGGYALQGSRLVRGVLTGLAVVVVCASLAADPLFGVLLAFTVGQLWSRPARDWYAGRSPAAEAVLQEAEGPRGEQPSDPRPGDPGTSQQPPPTYGYGAWPPSPTHPGAPPGPVGQPPGPHQPGPYQSAPYPQGPHHPGSGGPRQRPGVPGTVRAAAIVTWVVSALTFVFLVVGITAINRSSILDQAMRQLRQAGDTSLTRGDLAAAVTVVLVIGMVWAALACVFAFFVWRGHNWARVVLTVSAVVAGLLSLVSVRRIFPILPLVACIVVIVLLYRRSSNSHFAGRAAGPPAAWPQQPGPWQPGPHQHAGYQQGPYQPGPYQQGPYQQGPYQQGPYQQGPYQQGPYQQGPYQQGQYQPGPYPHGSGQPPPPPPPAYPGPPPEAPPGRAAGEQGRGEGASPADDSDDSDDSGDKPVW